MFEFLKANDVVIGLSQPLHQDGQPAINTIYVKGCDASHIFNQSGIRHTRCRCTEQLLQSGSSMNPTTAFRKTTQIFADSSLSAIGSPAAKRPMKSAP